MKKFVSLFLIIAMLSVSFATSLSVSAAVTPAFMSGTVTKCETVKVTLNLDVNPGINTLVMSLAYNSEALSLKSITNGKIFNDKHNGSLIEVNTENNPLIFFFEENGVANITSVGNLVEVEFDVIDKNAPYNFVVKVDRENTFAASSTRPVVPVETPVAIIFSYDEVEPQPNVIKGDLNNDGNVNAIDSNLLKKILIGADDFDEYALLAADVNSDGNVNAIDSNLMIKYLGGAIADFNA